MGCKRYKKRWRGMVLLSDNGAEVIARVILRWLKTNAIEIIYIKPGFPK